jgi:hypothetical protein
VSHQRKGPVALSKSNERGLGIQSVGLERRGPKKKKEKCRKRKKKEK